LFLALHLTAFSVPSLAATLTVTSNADDGSPGTLRSVIAAAAPGDTIDFAVGGTIVLTQGQILLDKDLAIAGPGATTLQIKKDSMIRIFETVVDADVEIRDITLTDAGGFPDAGGAILNHGNLTIRDTHIEKTSIYGAGGGILNSETGTLEILNSIVEDTSGHGSVYSAIHNDGGTVIATRLTLNRNGWDDTAGSQIYNASGRFCSASGFLDTELIVFSVMPPRPALRGRAGPGRDSGSRTSPASTARCRCA